MCIQTNKFTCFSSNCINRATCDIFKTMVKRVDDLISLYFFHHSLNEPIDSYWLYIMSTGNEELHEAINRLNKRRNEYINDKTIKTMETKEIIIVAPEGYTIDKENSTFEKIVFKKVDNKLPKTWEELQYISGAYVVDKSVLLANVVKTNGINKNVYPSRKLAEASLALPQLVQLRDRYNGDDKGFIPNTNNYIIYCRDNAIVVHEREHINAILAFRTDKLRDEFLTNFKNLIEIAKPLL